MPIYYNQIMMKRTDRIQFGLAVKRALAAMFAAVFCFYLSAGMMPSRIVIADETKDEAAAGEEAGPADSKDGEGKSGKEGSGSNSGKEDKKTPAKNDEQPAKKSGDTEDKKEPETKDEGNKEPENKEPEQKEPENKEPENKEPENKESGNKEPEVKDETPATEKPEEPGSDTDGDDTGTKPDEPSGEDKGDPSESTSGDPAEDPEKKPSETPSENPSDTPSEENPSAQPKETGDEKPADVIRYSLSGKGYLPKNKGKKGSFKDGVLTLGRKGKRLEAFTINFSNRTGYSGSLSYRAYSRKKGWSKWVKPGKKVGTKKKNLRIEAVQIKLTGELAKHYFVEYKATLNKLGDSQGWVRNGELAGARYNSKRIEVLQVRLVPIEKNTTSSVIYRLRGQAYGWQGTWRRDGEAAGAFSRRVEAITIALGPTKYTGGISYRSYVKGKWTGWVSGGSMSGSKKSGVRLDALQIKLTGDMAQYYNVYYRVYVQSFGWLDWAENGQTAGTGGAYRRIEKIQIVLREKGTGEPGNVGGIVSAKPHAYYGPSNTNAIMTYKNILDAGYTDPDVFRRNLISNFEYMKDVGYFHMGKMVQGYTDCAGSVSLAFRVALKTAKFTKKYKKGTRSDGSQLYGIGVSYCGIKSYKDKYGWCRNGTASVNSHFLNTIVKKRDIKYSQIFLNDRSDGVPGWSNAEWVDYLTKAGAKPGDVFVWFNHDWSKTKGQHMTMYAGIENGIAYEWTASSTYGVIKSPLSDRSPQKIFESFTLLKAVAVLNGSN